MSGINSNCCLHFWQLVLSILVGFGFAQWESSWYDDHQQLWIQIVHAIVQGLIILIGTGLVTQVFCDDHFEDFEFFEERHGQLTCRAICTMIWHIIAFIGVIVSFYYIEKNVNSSFVRSSKRSENNLGLHIAQGLTQVICHALISCSSRACRREKIRYERIESDYKVWNDNDYKIRYYSYFAIKKVFKHWKVLNLFNLLREVLDGN